MRFFCYILEKKDDFDWGKYLMEGEEIYLSPNIDTPVSVNSFPIENINTFQVIEMTFMGPSVLQQLN